MNEKLSEFKIKIGREVSQSTEITTELNKLNVKLEQLWGFVFSIIGAKYAPSDIIIIFTHTTVIFPIVHPVDFQLI
jgi:hypothetical protein